MKKIVKVILKVVIGLVCFVLFVLGAVKLVDWIAFSAFYTKAEVAFSAPGVDDGFVPQGFDYIEEEKTFLVTGLWQTARRVAST